MEEVIKWIAGVVLGGGALGVVGLGILLITKDAIAKAITHAGNVELERLKAELAKQLKDDERTGQRLLEKFKAELAAELTLDAEVRRRTATLRVDALLKVVSMGQTLLSRLLAHPGTRTADGYVALTSEHIAVFNEYLEAMRAVQPLVDAGTFETLDQFAQHTRHDLARFHETHDGRVLNEAVKRVEDLVDIARRLLFITTPAVQDLS